METNPPIPNHLKYFAIDHDFTVVGFESEHYYYEHLIQKWVTTEGRMQIIEMTYSEFIQLAKQKALNVVGLFSLEHEYEQLN